MTTSPGATSGLRWKEGTEGLQFGEVFVGGLASIYVVRGRSIGYGLYFTHQRVFGVRMRHLAQALLATYLIVISLLYLVVFFELGSREILFLFLPLVIILADQALRVLSRRFSERIISRRSVDIAWLIKRKKDFELSKKEIEELLMKSPLRGLNLGGSRGYVRITPEHHQMQPMKIQVHDFN